MTGPTVPAPRFGAHLAADAGWAATSRLDGDAVTLELWERDGGGYRPRPTGLVVDPLDQLLPLPGGRLLICGGAGRTHTVWAVDRATLTRTRLTARTGRAVRLLAPAPADPDRRAWTLAYDGRRTTLARLDGDGDPPRAPVGFDLPGAYAGGVWTDPAGRRLALGRSVSGEPWTAVEVSTDTDTSTGTDTGRGMFEVTGRGLFEVTARSNDTLQGWHAGTGLGVVHTDVGGVERLGFGYPGRGVDWAFPDALAAPDGLVEALAVDPAGTRILVHEQRGLCSLLHRYDIARQARDTLPVPPGALAGNPVWTVDRLVVPWSTPEVPLTFLDFGPDGTRRVHTGAETIRIGRRTTGAGTGPGPEPVARVVTVPGATGPIEAMAYGGDRWWRRPQVLVALHGGPSSAWRFTYHPFFARLAARDVAVLAINPRGSTGYGYAFAAAIRAGWGGQDLDDVLAVGRYLHARRGGATGTGLYGSSYGAFLALLATAAGPQWWEHCVAVAPFASAARLHRQAGPAVRRMIEQLGGLTDPPPDGLGARDVIDLADRIRARLLLVHGRYDERIPVAHARELAAALDRAPGPTVRYVEHDTGHDAERAATWELIARFIRCPDEAAPPPSSPAAGPKTGPTKGPVHHAHR